MLINERQDIDENSFIKNEGNESPIEQSEKFHILRILEALLFSSPDPIPLNKIKEIIDRVYPLKPKALRQLIEELQKEYVSQQRAFSIEEIAQGFILRSLAEYAPYIELLGHQKRVEKLSKASKEVLAIVAYRQPVTRADVEAIRGVDSSSIMTHLLERELIIAIGKLEVPGRPTTYGTTKEFLIHFGLKDLSALPSIENK